MEIKGAWLAELVGTSRQNIYTLCKQGKLIKSNSGEFNIFTPENQNYLTSHGKSRLEAEKFIKDKQSIVRGRQGKVINQETVKKKQVESKKAPDQSILLVEIMSDVITELIDSKTANKIKNEIFTRFKERVNG